MLPASPSRILHFSLLKSSHMSTVPPKRNRLRWESTVAGGAAGLTTLAIKYPLDIVQTRFEVNDRRLFSQFPKYNSTVHAIFTIARTEGLKGLYAGFLTKTIGLTIGSFIALSAYLSCYSKAKQEQARSKEAKQSDAKSIEEPFRPSLAATLQSAALVCLCTNPFTVVKTRLQLQTPLHQARPYSGIYDAFRTIKREEGFSALYRGIVPGLECDPYSNWVISIAVATTSAILLDTIFFAAHIIVYEKLRRTVVDSKTKGSTIQHQNPDKILNSVHYVALGAVTTIAATLPIHPFHVIGTRLQQRPDSDGIPRYKNSWHVVKETARYEGLRGFYKGITPSILKHIPVSSISFVVYENVLKLLKLASRND